MIKALILAVTYTLLPPTTPPAKKVIDKNAILLKAANELEKKFGLKAAKMYTCEQDADLAVIRYVTPSDGEFVVLYVWQEGEWLSRLFQ